MFLTEGPERAMYETSEERVQEAVRAQVAGTTACRPLATVSQVLSTRE